jgi:hypothetical protein
VFGVALVVFNLAVGLLQNFVVANAIVTILGVVSFIVTIVLNLLAGVRASQWTGRVRTGALAGLIMELSGFLFGVISTSTFLFVFDTPRHRLYLQAISDNVLLFIIYLIIYFVVLLLLGAVIGAIGGLIGRRRA